MSQNDLFGGGFREQTGDARFSECGRYRYTLARTWGVAPFACWVMLNPSTADASQDDPTIRRCIGFSKAWGYGGLCVVNLFAFRATDPVAMKLQTDPVGPGNDEAILGAADERELVVAAWGVHGTHRGRAADVLRLLREAGSVVHCLGATKDGHPKHPLYVAGATKAVLFKTEGT